MIRIAEKKQKMSTLIGTILMCVNVGIILIGLYLMVHSLKHLGESSGETGSVTIEHIGSVTGAPHLVGLFMGVSMICFSLTFLYKAYKTSISTEHEHKVRSFIDYHSPFGEQ